MKTHLRFYLLDCSISLIHWKTVWNQPINTLKQHWWSFLISICFNQRKIESSEMFISYYCIIIFLGNSSKYALAMSLCCEKLKQNKHCTVKPQNFIINSDCKHLHIVHIFLINMKLKIIISHTFFEFHK